MTGRPAARRCPDCDDRGRRHDPRTGRVDACARCARLAEHDYQQALADRRQAAE